MKRSEVIGVARYLVWLLCILASSVRAEMPLNGVAIYSRFGQEQFLAGLYVQKPTTREGDLFQSGAPAVMELRIEDDRIFPRRFQRMWVEGIAINARDQELELFAPLMADFSNMLNIQLRRGDIFRIERTAGETVRIQLNDTTLGELADPLFFDLLLRTWIGPVPLSSEFKGALLKAGSIGTEPLKRFLTLAPTAERKAQVASALSERRAEIARAATMPAKSAAGTVASVPPAAPQPIETPGTDAATSHVPAPQDDDTAEPTAPAPLPDASASSDPPDQPPTTAADNVTAPEDSVLLSADTEVTVSAASILMEQRYVSSLIRRTQSFAKYPRVALKRKQEGTVRVTVTLSPAGKVLDIEYEEKSRYNALNDAAYEAIMDADPFPSMPPELAESQFQFSVPIVFRLQ